MYHLHFNNIPSTQIYLKDNLELLKTNNENVLISSSEQTEGVGRRGNTWDSYPNSLALSFTLKPNAITSLTPIEVGLMVSQFFKKKYDCEIYLKWPNDILTSDGKKCGGILCQYIDSSTVVVGLGVNLGKLDVKENISYRHGLGSVNQFLELQASDQEKISHELYSHILQNRFVDPLNLKSTFIKKCSHSNSDVFIHEDGKDYIGIFRGIGDSGEALIEIDEKIHSFISSSLTILT